MPDNLDFGSTIRGFSTGQKVFNRYTLGRILGRGGMGVVWLARDEELDRDVALKFLPEVVAMDEQAVDDLKRETRRSLDLTHSHIVRIYDFLQDALAAAISMEFVDGRTLASLKLEQPEKRFEVAQIETWVRQLCDALSYAHHSAEVVHRDLKPANLMIDAKDNLKIADFGIAASVSDSVSRVSVQAGTSGTPVYMSPQQMMGENPAIADDIYALGATLFDLLTGRPPFYSGNIMMQVMNKPAPTLTERRHETEMEGEAIPSNWESTIATCLAKEPDQRPSTIAEVVAGLEGRSASIAPTAPALVQSKAKPAQTEASKLPATTAPPKSEGGSKKFTLVTVVALVAVLIACGGWFWQSARKQAAEKARLEAIAIEETAERERQAELARVAAEKEAKREAAEQAAQRDAEELKRVEQMLELRSTYAELALQWQRVEEELTDAQNESQRLQSELRFADRATVGVRNKLQAQTLAQQEFVAWLNQFIDEHPARLLQARAKEYLAAEAIMGSQNVLEEWRDSMTGSLATIATEHSTRTKITGVIDISSEPSGLTWTVADAFGEERSGTTPASLTEIGVGGALVSVMRDGFPEQRRNSEVIAGETTELNFSFPDGDLLINSAPSGAEVWHEGELVGTTPFERRGIRPGDYQYRVSLNGFHDQEFTSEVKIAEVAEHTVQLEKDPDIHLPGTGIVMKYIPAGSFTMGSLNGQKDEKPLTQVTFTQPFWIAETELTVAQHNSIMKAQTRTLIKVEDGYHNYPVIRNPGNSYFTYLTVILNSQEKYTQLIPEGYVFRLPYEEEWEYACRAGTTGDVYGNIDEIAWHPGNSSGRHHEVKQKIPNAWGLYDMLGNVWELTEDLVVWHKKEPYPGGKIIDPSIDPVFQIKFNNTFNPAGRGYVRRGGSFKQYGNLPNTTRTSNRAEHVDSVYTANQLNDTGYRLILAPKR